MKRGRASSQLPRSPTSCNLSVASASPARLITHPLIVATLASKFRMVLKFANENRSASTKNFLYGSEIAVQTFVKSRFFTFRWRIFAPLKKYRALACFVYSNGGVRTRDEFRRLFQGYCRSPTTEEPKYSRSVLSRELLELRMQRLGGRAPRARSTANSR